MLQRVEIAVRRLRRHLSRSQLAIKLLGLSRQLGDGDKTGLVMIQIDALSKKQLEAAVAAGRMPFLRDLLDKENYEVHTHYSGVPVSTADVQGELFYGVKSAVPAFRFLNRKSGRIFTMFNPADALEVERRLEKQGRPLLAGGSAYSDVYTGGAAEAHFCISNLGFGGILRSRYPLGFIIFVTMHLYSLLRTLALILVETGLAVIDCIRGVITGLSFRKELGFVPSRVAICVLLRELVTIGAKIDVARGMPIIHLNLMGWHEQSHRRGPNSRFAHWTLRGIDDAIKRIWKAAHQSAARHYHVWVYSDHGQVDTVPYEKKFGKSVQPAVADTLGNRPHDVEADADSKRLGLLARAGLRRRTFFENIFPRVTADPANAVVAALAPLGHVYLRKPVGLEEREKLAADLVQNAHIPMVLMPVSEDKIEVWTSNARLSIPENAEQVFDSAAPFHAEMVDDFLRACRHPDCGDIMICGWQGEGKDYYSFAVENGSHGGLRREEAEGFVLAPRDAGLVGLEKGYMRPSDLRISAFNLLDETGDKVEDAFRPSTAADTLRIVTYNVHGCVGMDGKLSPQRIARVISQYQPDIVALQELDRGRIRSRKQDQAMLIADYLNMDHHFHAVMQVAEESFGDAILSSYPMRLVKGSPFAAAPRFSFSEPRGALWVQIDFNGRCIQILNTHLGLNRRDRMAHARELLGSDWLGSRHCGNLVVLCGDFNAMPGSKLLRLFDSRLSSVQTSANPGKHKSTWFGRYPLVCLDHVFISSDFEVIQAAVGDTYLTRLASDHRPLIAEVRLRRTERS